MTVVEIGRYATSAPMGVDVTQWHTLISGLSGSGKSSTLRALLVGAARNPSIALALLDVKRVEFSLWRPRASVVAVDHDHITATLRQLGDLVDERFKILDDEGARDWTISRSRPGVLVAVDELAGLTGSGDKPRDRINTAALRHVLERGRAAGVTVAAAIQRPAAEVVPTSLRDLFQCRIIHALLDETSVGMAAGADAATAPAHKLPIGKKHAGLAYVLLDGERQGQMARSYWVDEATAKRVAARTAPDRHDLFPAALEPSPLPSPRQALGSSTIPRRAATTGDLDDDEQRVWAAFTTTRIVLAKDLKVRTGLSEGRARRAAQSLADRHYLRRSSSNWERIR